MHIQFKTVIHSTSSRTGHMVHCPGCSWTPLKCWLSLCLLEGRSIPEWSLGRKKFDRCPSWCWVDGSCSFPVFLYLMPGGRHLLRLLLGDAGSLKKNSKLRRPFALLISSGSHPSLITILVTFPGWRSMLFLVLNRASILSVFSNCSIIPILCGSQMDAAYSRVGRTTASQALTRADDLHPLMLRLRKVFADGDTRYILYLLESTISSWWLWSEPFTLMVISLLATLVTTHFSGWNDLSLFLPFFQFYQVTLHRLCIMILVCLQSRQSSAKRRPSDLVTSGR